jgi:hypothetical protein
MAARMAEALREYGLLMPPHRLEHDWYVLHAGGIGVSTGLALTVPLGDARLPDQVLRSRPSGFPNAEVDDIHVVGSGTWIDAEGKPHSEPRLVDLPVSPNPIGLSAELAVHHDIWGEFDFRGQPHVDVWKHNAPRLASALQVLDSLLGVAAEPGEATYFGRAEGYGIHGPEVVDGRGPDLTDLL